MDEKIPKGQLEAAMKECANKYRLLWLSTIPSGVLTMVGVKYFARNKNFRYGGWPVAIGSGVFISVLVNVTSANIWNRCVIDKVTHRRVLNINGRKVELDISDLEKSIYLDCKSDAFWKYSVPLMALCAGATQAAISQGHLAPSTIFKLAPSAPKVIVGAAFGYQLGHLLWMVNNDCNMRFEHFAADGVVNKEIQRQKEMKKMIKKPPNIGHDKSVEIESDEKKAVLEEVEEVEEDYRFPSDNLKDLDITEK